MFVVIELLYENLNIKIIAELNNGNLSFIYDKEKTNRKRITKVEKK
jgi:hypothetical protein